VVLSLYGPYAKKLSNTQAEKYAAPFERYTELH
jgi:ABC-type transporter MlaC component